MSWQEKPLSQAALDDEAQHSEYMQKLAADLAAEPPPLAPRAPAPKAQHVRKADLDRALSRLSVTIGKAVRQMVVEPLTRRIAELEAREWVGVFQTGKTYAKNSIVSHDGSCWVAARDCPEGKPGTGPACGWRLIVKRGRDGKDATK